jgi:Nif-specific regulatory protein
MTGAVERVWMRAADCPLLREDGKAAGAEALCRLQRLLRAAVGVQGGDDVAAALLAEIVGGLRADQAAVLEAPRWQACWRHVRPGTRLPEPSLPCAVLGEVLHSEGGVRQSAAAGSPAVLAAGLGRGEGGNRVLVVARARDSFDGEELAYAVAAGRHLGAALERARAWDERAAGLERAGVLFDIARRVIEKHEVLPLLDHIAEQARRLSGCERASLFLWDQDRGELVARPALGMEGGELRLPDDAGVVGTVVHTGRVYPLDDVREDPTWNSRVDQDSGFRTRNLLCVPLLGPTGACLGALEVLNKARGQFSPQDVETLQALAWQAAAALQDGREREALLRSNAVYEGQARLSCRIVGDSPAVRSLRATVERLARTDLPVLLLGESGTGKEVVARALHYSSPREHQPFVPVNCAALPENLLESELFGHVQGAFTGADRDRVGQFEAASGGTLFLDEIGEMSAAGQAKLLRVLEDRAVCRVGSGTPIPIHTRIVAATNRDLAEHLHDGGFREDLFYRLSVVTIRLPPLRERREDVPLLARHYLEQFGRDAGRPRLRLSADAVRRLQQHPWPGNVRELRNLMERVAFLCPNEVVEADDLPLIARPAAAQDHDLGDLPLAEATDRFQRAHIQRAIERAGRNVSEAARLLGLHRSNLYRKMRLLGMDTSGLVRGLAAVPLHA